MADPVRALVVKAAVARVPAARGIAPSMRRVGDRRIYTFRVPGPAAPGRPPSAQLVKVTVGPEDEVLKVLVSRS